MSERAGEKSMAVRLIEARTQKPFADEIRRRRQAGMSFRQIGAEFGISGQTIWRNWRDQAEAGGHVPVR
jgi:DNA invertase Pin-like site-specific DNA recombinase